MIVREVARELPDHVDGVVLFGSPIIGGPMHTIAARTFDPAEAALATAALEALDAERPVRVPLTSIKRQMRPAPKRLFDRLRRISNPKTSNSP